MELGPVEMRVLGSLVEKQRTTPDAYPLTLNALRLACNQSTNRDPVVQFDDDAIRAGLDRLGHKRFTRLASGQGSRAPKYRHLLAETLELDHGELAILAVMMLRGPQTPGELKGRADRLHGFEDLAAVQATLERLAQRGHVRRLDRRPGQKEERYVQLLGDRGSEAEAAGGERPGDGTSALEANDPSDVGEHEPSDGGMDGPSAAPMREPADGRALTSSGGGAPEQSDPRTPASPVAATPVEARLSRLEEEVAALRETLERLREELGA